MKTDARNACPYCTRMFFKTHALLRYHIIDDHGKDIGEKN